MRWDYIRISDDFYLKKDAIEMVEINRSLDTISYSIYAGNTVYSPLYLDYNMLGDYDLYYSSSGYNCYVKKNSNVFYSNGRYTYLPGVSDEN